MLVLSFSGLCVENAGMVQKAPGAREEGEGPIQRVQDPGIHRLVSLGHDRFQCSVDVCLWTRLSVNKSVHTYASITHVFKYAYSGSTDTHTHPCIHMFCIHIYTYTHGDISNLSLPSPSPSTTFTEQAEQHHHPRTTSCPS